MILRNARIVDLASGESSLPRTVQVSGPRATVKSGGAGEQVDVEGAFVLPGLWDEHIHLGQWAMHRQRVQLPAGSSAAECAALVARLVAERGGPEPFVAIGFRDSGWPDRPNRHLLDQVTGGIPVVLVSADMHTVWANTAGLAHYGMGHGMGHLVEGEAFEMELRISRLPDAVLDAWLADACRQLAGLGVVGVTEIECADNPLAWARRMDHGLDLLRVRASVWPQHLAAALARGHRTGDVLDETGLLTMGPLKVIVDGSMTARTAWCFDEHDNPHPDHPRGVLSVPRDRLLELMSEAHGAGLEVALHAIGDAAIALVLDCFEATGARGSIEHCQLVRDVDIARMAALGVRASVQPSHATTGPGPALAEAGVELALGSDAPVVEPNPWQAISDAVRQGLDVRRALLASTHGTARVDADRASDLVVLDRNPLSLNVDELAGLRSRLTVVGGRATHRD